MNRTLAVAFAAALFWSCPHAPPPTPTPTPTPPVPPPTPPITGIVDLHTHPMSNLGFAGKLLYGGPDWEPDGGGSLLPADPSCNFNVRARVYPQALGHDKSTHGEWDFHNVCGDTIRAQVITALQTLDNANNPPQDGFGADDFHDWPKSNDVTHQVMWADSIRRAYDAGLRVMVALAVNNTTLADLVAGHGDGPGDDMSSADLQIAEMKSFIGRHGDFMEIAYTADELAAIVARNHLAVVLGMEVDNIGDFNARPHNLADIAAEIARLKAQGVRYIFPVHLIDNPWGHTAANTDLFDISNLREAGHFWNLQCANPADQITYRPTLKNPLNDPFFDSQTFQMAFLMVFKLHLFSHADPSPPPCPLDGGVVNVGVGFPGLTAEGSFAVKEMMSQCMMLDLDHMSMASRGDVFRLVLDAGYPINSGHNNVRSPTAGQTERQLTPAEYAQIASLGGMAGIGASRIDEVQFVSESEAVMAALGDAGVIAFGTDSNGVSPLMGAPRPGAPQVTYSGSYAKSQLGTKQWDYNDAGVAHYGIISDFLEGVKQVDGGLAVVANMMKGAQAFREQWKRAESFCNVHPPVDAGTPSPIGHSHHFLMSSPSCTEGLVFRHACNRCLPPRESCPRCEDGSDGGCLPAPESAPRGSRRNMWGICSTVPENEAALDLPLKLKLKKGVGVKPGKYVLVLNDTQKFSVELLEAKGGNKGPPGGQWLMKGGPKPITANAGVVGGLWALHWVSGKMVVMMTLQAKDAPPYKGGFAVHQPGAPVVTGEVRLEPPVKDTAGVKPLDQLPAFFDALP